MFLSSVIKLYKQGSVSVSGCKGSGKDVLQGNVIARMKQPYVSNMDYTHDERYIPLNFDDLNINNTYVNFIEGKINHYVSPYPKGVHIFISDCGIILPSQYFSELNKRYPWLPSYFALSRQLNEGGEIHTNAQELSRVWDKVREQSDIYIRCNGINKFFIKFGLVVQTITIYDKYESAVARVKPCRVSKPLLNRQAQASVDIYRDDFFNKHGTVKRRLLIYLNKSKHDTYHFKKLLGGDFNEK